MNELDIGIWNPRVGTAQAGGTETFLRNVVRELAGEHQITIYTGDGDPHPEIRDLPPEVMVKWLPWRSKGDRLVRAMARWTPALPAEMESISMAYGAYRHGAFRRMSRHDVVSTHYYADALVVSKVVDTAHLFRFAGIKQPSPRWRVLIGGADIDQWVANAGNTAARVREWYDFPVDGVVHPGVNTEAFVPTAGDGGTDRDEILFVGRLDHGKGLYNLLAAHDQLNDVTLRIVGDGVLKDELNRSAGDGVVFEGRVPHEDLPPLYAGADAVAVPSSHEGYPVVVLEAMATATPVVASDLPATRDQLRDRSTGWLVEPGDVDELAEALHSAIWSPDYQAGIARDDAREYAWDRTADRLAEHYAAAAGATS